MMIFIIILLLISLSISLLIYFLISLYKINDKYNYKYKNNLEKKLFTLYDFNYSNKNNSTFNLILPVNSKNNSCLIYFHGGYYKKEDKKDRSYFCSYLSNKFNIPIINANYSLSTKNKFPYQLNQAIELYNFIKNNFNYKKIYFGGDSSGAHLASLLSTKIQCDGLLLISGFYDIKNLSYFPFLLQICLW